MPVTWSACTCVFTAFASLKPSSFSSFASRSTVTSTGSRYKRLQLIVYSKLTNNDGLLGPLASQNISISGGFLLEKLPEYDLIGHISARTDNASVHKLNPPDLPRANLGTGLSFLFQVGRVQSRDAKRVLSARVGLDKAC